MAKNCAIIPKVKNKKGLVVDSKLFKDLLSFTSNNRSEATKIYLITKNDSFIRDWNPRLTLDANNEPTIKSLLDKTNLSTLIPEQKVLEKLNKDIGYYKRDMDRPALWLNNDENYNKLLDKAIRFNQNSEFRDKYVANIIKIQDNESPRIFIGVKIEKRNKLNSVNADNMEYNEQLNIRLRNILSNHGVSIGALTNLEKRMGIHGVTDFNVAKTSAEGLVEIIRLANDIHGEKALPEEFAHFIIEAMGDNPLINRLVNNIHSNNLTREIIGDDYDTYNTLYEGDDAKLAKEAAGKLLAKHLLNNELIPAKSYKNLLNRVIDSVKNFFKNMNANAIQKSIKEANKDFGSLARQILDGSMDDNISINNIRSNELYYNTSERVERDKKLLLSIIDNEAKRLKIYEKTTGNGKFSTNQRLLIDRLETELIDNNEIEGIYTFAQNALEELVKVNDRLTVLYNTPATDVSERAKVLRDVRNYLYSYQHINDDIKKALVSEEKFADNRYGQRVRVVIDNISVLLGDLFIDYNNVAMPLFVDFIKPFVGESITIPFGKWKNKTMTVEELIKGVKKDREGKVEWYQEEISFFDRWLDSMADSSAYVLKIFDQAVKKSKETGRLRVIDASKLIQAATIKLEQAGIKNTDWMFERDSQGNLTGNYISEINLGLFKEKVREMYKRLNDKYGKNPVGKAAEDYKNERLAWYDYNMEIVDGKKRPKMSIYENKDFKRLTTALKDYYNTIMDIKSKLDSYIPDKYTTLTNTVKIRKDLLERVKNSDDVKSGVKQLWESLKDDFIRRSDDIDFGSKLTIKDFEGNEVLNLPIYYTKLKDGESSNDISTDIASTLTAYAAMAIDFDEMNKIIDVLEISRSYLRDNLDIHKTEGGKPLVEKFKSVGRTIENAIVKDKDDRRIIQRLNDFMEMLVYGRYMADEGTFGNTKIDKGKVANFVNRVTSLNNLAINILSGISNIATGSVMMRIESFAKEFYTEKNTLTADRIYGQSLPLFLEEVGSRVKTNKLALWDELFNVMQDYETDVRNLNFDRKTWFSRMFNTSSLFFMSNAGEHWMLNRTSLALSDAYKMKAPNGKIVSLWDAMEPVLIDKNNKKLGAKLLVKEGYTKEDGTAFTNNDIIAFSRKSAAINLRMHGIYNKADRSAVQRLAIGRMGVMFRKWMKPSLNRRFESSTYNYDLQSWTEGYYRTTGRFLTQLAKELKEGQFALISNFKNLNPTEKANIKRAITEVGHFLLIALILGLMEWSDDDDRPWLIKMAEYQARRLYTELGSLIPGPTMVSEGLKLIKSPAAGINTIENTLDLIGLMNPFNYEIFNGEDALLESGRFKDKSRATKLFFESPLLPMNKTIYRGLYPETGIPFYKQ